MLLTLVAALWATGALHAQDRPVTVGEKTVTFRFVPQNDMFYTPWRGNGAELERLYSLIDNYRAEIAE